MTHFLKPSRRNELREQFIGLTMPAVYADAILSIEFNEDNLGELDDYLTHHSQGVLEWAQRMADAAVEKNEEDMKMYAMYLTADMLLLDAYTEECRERGVMSAENFPKFLEAAKIGVVKSREIQEYARRELHVTQDNTPNTLH